MNRPVLTASLAATLWLALGSTPAVRAAAIDPAPPVSPVTDVQDLLFLGDDGPVLIRLHLQLEGGKSFTTVWDDYLHAMFKYMDRDGDHLLSESEARFVPSASIMLQAQRNGFFIGQNSFASFAELKKDALATRISFDDLAAYYRNAGVGGVQVIEAPANFGRAGMSLSDALFTALDTNGDGKLSREEIQNAERSLRKLDADDDETISSAEVLGLSGQQPFLGMPAPAGPMTLVPVQARGELTALGTRIVNHYDRDKNQKLSREEIGLDAASFNKLDLNRDGALDGIEVLGLLRQQPLIELTVHLGRLDLGQKAVESVGPPPANTRLTTEGLAITVGNAQIDFGRVGGSTAAGSNFRPFLLQQFRAADKAKKGFLDVADLAGGQLRFLKPLMPMLDRDGDGKLSEKELREYLDLQDQVRNTAFSVQAGESAQGLFDVIDLDRDGRLSARELRTAWDRLAKWDHNRDGVITRREIPRAIEVSVLRGAAAFGGNRMVMLQQGRIPAARVPRKGPLWFRKMDRNADGVLSPREFLGTAEDFKKLDTDGDGFIDAAEAEKAGEVLGKRADAKP